MKILLIAYYYPPINSGGTERPVKMVKHLPALGHPVTVLTHAYGRAAERTAPPALRVRDISHNKDRHGVHQLIWYGLRGYVELANRAGRYASIYGWWKNAVLQNAAQIIATTTPDVILATYPPVEDLEIGIALAQRYHIPLVVDFRDGLLFEPIELTRMAQYRCIRAAYQRIERAAVQQAALILTVSPPITDYFRATYQHPQVVTLPNGFDPDDFPSPSATPCGDPPQFQIVHTGRVGGSYAARSITPFSNALRRVLAAHPELKRTVRVHFVGALERQENAQLHDLIRDGIVLTHGLLERAQALAFQQQAQLLLLITDTRRQSAATTKLFEYLGAGKPILALTAGTYAAEIIQATGAGWAVAPDDEQGIEQTLTAILCEPGFSQALRRDAQAIAQFSRRQQMETLSRLFATLFPSQRK